MRVTLNMMAEPGMFGMKRYTLELSQALRPLGAEATIRHSRRLEARVGRLRVGGLVTSRLRNWVPVRRRDLLHATDHKSNPHLPSADVVTVHDLIPMERPDLVDDVRIARRDGGEAVRAVATAKRLIAPTAFVRDTLVRRLGADASQVHVVPHGIRHDIFHPGSPAEPAEPGTAPSSAAAASAPFVAGRLNVLVAMNAERRKRVDLVCQAALGLPFVHVVHAGRTDLTAGDLALRERHAATAGRLAAQGRYTHLEATDDDALRDLYARADVVAHVSEAEGFGFPPLEALACGARVLASDIPPHRQVLGDAARFVAVDAAAIAAEFAAAWDGTHPKDGRFPPRARRLAHAAGFTWERTARLTLATYQEALDG